MLCLTCMQHFVPIQPLAPHLKKLGIWKAPYRHVDMSAKRYFDKHHGRKGNKYVYFSADIDRKQLKRRDLRAIKKILPDMRDILDADSWLFKRDAQLTSHLWIGHANVVSPIHYDMSHNIYVQLWGTKKFTMFLNDEDLHANIPLHPMIHPSLRKYPHNITGPLQTQREAFPNLKRIYTTVLHPGAKSRSG